MTDGTAKLTGTLGLRVIRKRTPLWKRILLALRGVR